MPRKKKNIKKDTLKTKSSKSVDFFRIVKNLFNKNPGSKFSITQILKKLKINSLESEIFLVLKKLEKKQIVLKDNLDKYFLNKSRLSNQEEMIGTVDHVSPFFAYIILKDRADIKIYHEDLKGAFHRDKVKIKNKNRNRYFVTEIIERYRNEFAGIIKNKDSKYIVKLDGRRYHYEVEVTNSKEFELNENTRVIISITEWPRNGYTIGEIIKILGKVGDHNSEIDSIIFQYDLPGEFPQILKDELKNISNHHNSITNNLVKRKDFRKINTITIDPENAKDFDDALSLETLPEGKKKIAVHVADVTAYVKEDSLIDEEAKARGNSTYLVDRTIPMLPEILSNDKCSLLPTKDRLTFSIEFLFDKNNKIQSFQVLEGIINSNKRFTYKEAQEAINNQKGEYLNELNEFMIISKLLKKDRIKHGAIEFVSEEFKVNLNHNNEVVKIKKKEIYDTNNLIEEFMLLANKFAAKYIYDKINHKNKNFIYRIHEDPNPDKLLELKKFLKIIGFNLNLSNNKISDSLKEVLKKTKNTPFESIANRYIIRTMSRAIYSPYQYQHFGLAFQYYTHFTSPIRRYSDLLVHRLMKKYLLIDDSKDLDIKYLEKICKHITQTEKNSSDAERASIKTKQVEYLKDKIGLQYRGIVTYISEKNLFIEIVENGCEGIVDFSNLTDDFFVFEKEKFRLRGKKTKRIIKIGDIILVKVENVYLEEKLIKFSI